MNSCLHGMDRCQAVRISDARPSSLSTPMSPRLSDDLTTRVGRDRLRSFLSVTRASNVNHFPVQMSPKKCVREKSCIHKPLVPLVKVLCLYPCKPTNAGLTNKPLSECSTGMLPSNCPRASFSCNDPPVLLTTTHSNVPKEKALPRRQHANSSKETFQE